jgi:DNA-binding XRE family transcriptional regulator
MSTTRIEADLRQRLAEAEDEADALALRLAEIEHLACGGELFPLDLVRRLTEAKTSRFRIWREYRGFTLRELATTVKISPAMLSAIETGRKNGSVRTLVALARVLKIDVNDLLSTED